MKKKKLKEKLEFLKLKNKLGSAIASIILENIKHFNQLYNFKINFDSSKNGIKVTFKMLIIFLCDVDYFIFLPKTDLIDFINQMVYRKYKMEFNTWREI